VPSPATLPPPARCERSMPASSIPQTWYACPITLPLLGVTESPYNLSKRNGSNATEARLLGSLPSAQPGGIDFFLEVIPCASRLHEPLRKFNERRIVESAVYGRGVLQGFPRCVCRLLCSCIRPLTRRGDHGFCRTAADAGR
jgi:hypothetical protein